MRSKERQHDERQNEKLGLSGKGKRKDKKEIYGKTMLYHSWNKALCLNNTACAIMVSFIFPEFLIRPNCNSVTISCSMRSIVPRGKNLSTNVRVASRFPSSISHSS